MDSTNTNVSAAGTPSPNDTRAPAPANPEMDEDPTTCPICQEEYTNADGTHPPVMTYCGHVFGKDCFYNWLLDSPHQDCPNCRKHQIHDCHHTCWPEPLSRHPPVAPRIEDRQLAARCFQCAHWHTLMFESDGDPALSRAKARRQTILEALGFQGEQRFMDPAELYACATVHPEPELPPAMADLLLPLLEDLFLWRVHEPLRRWLGDAGLLRW